MKEFAKAHACLIVYASLMLGSGVWQLLDWHYGTEDPIWHLFFYYLFMPAFSFAFGICAGNRRKFWLIPFIAAFLTAFVYIVMGNGGFRVDAVSPGGLKSALEVCVPSSLAALTGVILRRIVMIFQ